jgi:hypothetical protein
VLPGWNGCELEAPNNPGRKEENYSEVLHFITSAKTLVPDRVTFTGSRE